MADDDLLLCPWWMETPFSTDQNFYHLFFWNYEPEAPSFFNSNSFTFSSFDKCGVEISCDKTNWFKTQIFPYQVP